MKNEKRRFTRVSFNFEAELEAGGLVYSAEEIVNISVGGCLLLTEADLELGTVCDIRLFLGGASSELRVRVQGEVARSIPGALAVKFTRIDPDSLFHLQNIIRHNAPDIETVEKEILDHPGLI